MKLTELIEKLIAIGEDLEASGIDPAEVDVLAGVQPSYPLTNVIAGVITGQELDDYCEEQRLKDPELNAVWIAASPVSNFGESSKYSAYAPRPLWDAVDAL